MNEVWRVGLEEHNKLRRTHGVADLKGDPVMHSDAQRHAEFLASTNRFEATTMGKYGNMISSSFESCALNAIKDSVRRWYDGKHFYNFLDPGCKHMGIGIAKNGTTNRWIVVTFYDVPGMREMLNREF